MVQTTPTVRVSNEEVAIEEPEHAADYDRSRFGIDIGTILSLIHI